MSYLFFMDESGHDHRQMPYEVRGGFAIHASKLWTFIQSLVDLEQSCFGVKLSSYGSEIKGEKLLGKQRFKWADQLPPFDDGQRRVLCNSFFHKGSNGLPQTKPEFTAYGQASLRMAQGILQLMRSHECWILAAAIPRGAPKAAVAPNTDLLRKDLVFLFERYFYLLEEKDETGLIVMDQTEAKMDRRMLENFERFFKKTVKGRTRATRIIPSPFFVSSDLAYPVQAADVVIYAINWGYRIPGVWGGETRQEIADTFGGMLNALQYRGKTTYDGKEFPVFGINLVKDPFSNKS